MHLQELSLEPGARSEPPKPSRVNRGLCTTGCCIQRLKIPTIQLQRQGFCCSNIPEGLGGAEDIQHFRRSFYKYKCSLFQALNINDVNPHLFFPCLQPPTGSGFPGIILPYFCASKDRRRRFLPDFQPSEAKPKPWSVYLHGKAGGHHVLGPLELGEVDADPRLQQQRGLAVRPGGRTKELHPKIPGDPFPTRIFRDPTGHRSSHPTTHQAAECFLQCFPLRTFRVKITAFYQTKQQNFAENNSEITAGNYKTLIFTQHF